MTLIVEYFDDEQKNRIKEITAPDSWQKESTEVRNALVAMRLGHVHKIKSVKEKGIKC